MMIRHHINAPSVQRFAEHLVEANLYASFAEGYCSSGKHVEMPVWYSKAEVSHA